MRQLYSKYAWIVVLLLGVVFIVSLFTDILDDFWQRLAAIATVLAFFVALWPMIPPGFFNRISDDFHNFKNSIFTSIKGKKLPSRKILVNLIGLLLIFLSMGAFVWGWNVLQNGLRVCGWLDVRWQRSGCMGVFGEIPSNADLFFFNDDIIAARLTKKVERWDFVSDVFLPEVATPQTISAFSLIPNTSLGVTLEQDGMIRYWNLETASLLTVLTLPQTAYHVDQSTLVMTHSGGIVVVSDTRGNSLSVLKMPGFLQTSVISYTSVYAVSPETSFFAYSPDYHNIVILGTSDGLEMRQLSRDRMRVEKLVFSRDGKNLVVVLEGGIIERWDIITGKMLNSISVLRSPHSNVDVSDDGKYVAIIGLSNRVVEVWDLTLNKGNADFMRSFDEEIYDVALSPNIESIAVAKTAYTPWDQPIASSYEVQVWRLR